jgi:hypothetical protein
MVTGSGLGESNLPQNIGSGQRWRTTPPAWGSMDSYRIVGKMIGKLLYRPAGISHNDEDNV